MNVGQVFVDISLQMKNLQKGLQEAMSVAKSAGNAMEQALGNGPVNGLKNLDNQAKQTASRMEGYFKDVNRIVSGILISQAFYAAIQSIKSAGAALFEFNGQLQVAEASYTRLLGSNEKAKGFMQGVEELAVGTPFSFEQVDKGAKKLMAMGYTAESVLPMVENIGDAVAAVGGDDSTFAGITLALGQIRTKGKLSGEEMRQLAERQIDIYGILREELGLTGEQVANIGKQGITAAEAIPAIMRGMQKRYGGMMKEINETTPGIIMSIRDNLLLLGNTVGEVFFENLRDGLDSFRDSLEKLREVARDHGVGGLMEYLVPPALHDDVRRIAASFIMLGESFSRTFQAITPIITAFAQASTVISAALLPILAVFANVLSQVAFWMTQNEGAVKALVFALVGFKTVGFVSSMLVGLASAARTFAAAAGVAAIWGSRMAKAIQLALMALTATPVGRAVALVAVALTVLIASSKEATKWLDQLLARFYALLGIDGSGIFKPTSPEDNKWAEEYTKGLGEFGDQFEEAMEGADGAGGAIDDVGDKAKDAGKDAKKAAKDFKKFVAAFDEVYQVPEMDNAGSGGGGGDNDGGGPGGGGPGGGGGTTPKPPTPNVPGNTPPPVLPGLPPFIQLPTLVWPEIPPLPELPAFPPIKLPVPEWGPIPVPKMPKLPDWEMPRIPVPDFGPALEGVKEWVRDVGRALGDIPSGVTALLPKFNQAWERALQGIPQPVKNFAARLKTFWQQDIPNGVTAMIPNLKGAWETVTTAIGNTWDKFFGENHPLNKPLDEFLLDTLAFAAPGGAMAKAVGKVGGLFKGLPGQIGTLTAKILPDFSSLMGKMPGFSKTAVGSIEKFFKELPGKTSSAISGLPGVVSGWMGKLPAFGSTAVTNITTYFKGLGGKISSAISNLPSTVSGWMGKLPAYGSTAVTNITTYFRGLGGKISTAISDLPSKVSSWTSKLPSYGTSAVQGITNSFNNLGGKVWTAISDLPSKVVSWTSQLPSLGTKAVSGIASAFSSLGYKIGQAIKDVPGKVADILGDIKIPSFKAITKSAGASISASWNKLENLAGFATGGIIGRDSIVRVGEKGKREAIIPLQNEAAMQPFADAVASGIQRSGLGGGSSQPTLYVHTLIADRRGLAELERRLKVIRVGEELRGGS
jgi:tape measure domain-containing protein